MKSFVSFIKKINIDFITVYAILLLFSGFYFCEYYTIPAVLCVIALCFVKSHSINFNVNSLRICFLLIVLMCISEALSIIFFPNGNVADPKVLIYNLAIVVLACFYCNSISFSDFCDKYVQCVTIIAVVSICLGLLFTIIPSSIMMLPQLYNSNGKIGYFALFSIISDFSFTGVQRNQGIFWEPGAFQVFLCIAYILELSKSNYKTNYKTNNKILAVLIIAMISTISTTGFLVSILLVIYSFGIRKGKARVLKMLVASIIIVILVSALIPKLTGYLEYATVRKIDLIFNYQAGDKTAVSSRMDSFYYPLVFFLRSPIVGLGSPGYSEMSQITGHSMFTATPINWLVRYGIVFGIIIYYGLYKFFRKAFKDIFNALYLFIVFLISISSENFLNNIFILSFIFWGYMSQEWWKHDNCINKYM